MIDSISVDQVLLAAAVLITWLQNQRQRRRA